MFQLFVYMGFAILQPHLLWPYTFRTCVQSIFRAFQFVGSDSTFSKSHKIWNWNYNFLNIQLAMQIHSEKIKTTNGETATIQNWAEHISAISIHLSLLCTSIRMKFAFNFVQVNNAWSFDLLSLFTEDRNSWNESTINIQFGLPTTLTSFRKYLSLQGSIWRCFFFYFISFIQFCLQYQSLHSFHQRRYLWRRSQSWNRDLIYLR